jgi:hypothetical protein
MPTSKNSKACYIVFMRVFLLLLIFAIGFSGYSTASHAFGEDSCASATQSEMASNTDCATHTGNADAKKDTKNSDEKSVCLDCIHCCASHVANLANWSVSFSPVTAGHSSALSPVLKDNYLFSLLRPPKTII